MHVKVRLRCAADRQLAWIWALGSSVWLGPSCGASQLPVACLRQAALPEPKRRVVAAPVRSPPHRSPVLSACHVPGAPSSPLDLLYIYIPSIPSSGPQGKAAPHKSEFMELLLPGAKGCGCSLPQAPVQLPWKPWSPAGSDPGQHYCPRTAAGRSEPVAEELPPTLPLLPVFHWAGTSSYGRHSPALLRPRRATHKGEVDVPRLFFRRTGQTEHPS